MTISFHPLRNGYSADLAEIPSLTVVDLRRGILDRVSHGGRLSAFFARPMDGVVELVAVVAMDREGTIEIARAPVAGDSFTSLTPECPQAHLFEREIAEQWGVIPTGHPWLKPVRFHPSYRLGKDAFGRAPGDPITVGVMDFYRVAGEEIHEVAVGPVHAGVIEPGHFRFQCHGEQVFHLEISLGYQYRGIEKKLIGGPDTGTLHAMETLAGDTTIGHATAYCQAREGLAGMRPSARALALRGIALELERMANHTGDLGALAGDVGFLPTASFCGRLRGDFLNLSALLCGNRFGRGMVREGGVGFDVDAARAALAISRLDSTFKDVEGAVRLLWKTGTVQARFEDVGKVSEETARDLGLVGPAARACGLRRDIRATHPTGIYQFAQIPISTVHTGDVYGRAFIRWLEIERSVGFLRDQLRSLPAGDLRRACPIGAPSRICVSMVEGWRGEIVHVAISGGDGRFSSYKVVDPSFHNWSGLAMALRDQQISDFPLCNKSFNLSYCGFDL